LPLLVGRAQEYPNEWQCRGEESTNLVLKTSKWDSEDSKERDAMSFGLTRRNDAIRHKNTPGFDTSSVLENRAAP